MYLASLPPRPNVSGKGLAHCRNSQQNRGSGAPRSEMCAGLSQPLYEDIPQTLLNWVWRETLALGPLHPMGM